MTGKLDVDPQEWKLRITLRLLEQNKITGEQFRYLFNTIREAATKRSEPELGQALQAFYTISIRMLAGSSYLTPELYRSLRAGIDTLHP